MFSWLSNESSQYTLAITRLDLERAHSSIAPDNLRTAAESFRLALAVEDKQASVRGMQDTKAWKDLEGTLSAYADRLQLHGDQANRLNSLISQGALVSSLIMLAGSLALLWGWRSHSQVPPRDSTAKADPLHDHS